jgi:FkbM family methyltransferase
MRLYRQEQPGRDWSSVVGRIAIDLAALAQSERRPRRTSIEPQAGVSASIIAAASDHLASDGTASLRPQEAGGFNELAPCRSGLLLYNRNDAYIGASLRRYGEFSAGEAALFRIIVQPGMTVLDIGANIGVHAFDLSRLVGSAGVVHAFEPQRLIFQVLCANVALNSRSNVSTYHAAVGAGSGRVLVPLQDPDGDNNYGGLSLQGAQLGEAVSIIYIDNLDLGVCHFIKLDVEGMEPSL